MEWDNSVSRQRIRLLLITAAVLWMFFLGRFFYLQILSHEELSEAATAQHLVRVEGLDSRGMILDRNLQPLTGSTKKYWYFLPKDRLDYTAVSLLEAAAASEISAGDRNRSQYTVWQTELYDETVSRKLKEMYNAYILCLPSRYSSQQPACHLIGYLHEADQTGAAGLEKAFEERLKSTEKRLSLRADGSGHLLSFSAPVLLKENPLRPSGLVTTLDLNLQKLCDKAMYERDLTGAVLVSDAGTGEILAWVSSPYFNPDQVDQYLDKDGGELVNKCIQGEYPPGSVFKVVIAAAALESGDADLEREYLCTGKTEVEGVTLGCRAGPEGGHGSVNLRQAMAVSCNCYFANLGKTLGCEKILDMAERLGLGETVMGIFAEEADGKLPAAEEISPADISHLSIGQGALLTTPLQVHQMMSAVAADGMMVPLSVVHTGGNQPAERVLSEVSAAQLGDILRQVMVSGTGAYEDWPCPVYGKTGTAEAALDGRMVKQCWFSGFCEAGEKRFVITVLAEDGESGTATCLPVFRDITEYLNTAAGTLP